MMAPRTNRPPLMRYLFFAGMVLLLMGAGYSYTHDPAGCTKLANDFVALAQNLDSGLVKTPPLAASPAGDTTESVTANETPAPTSPALPASTDPLAAPPSDEAQRAAQGQEISNQFDLKNVTYDEALSQAKAENKKVLLDFTGSDWCPYCQDLDHEVLSSQAFQAFSVEHFIFVVVDFPRQTALPDDIRDQNEMLRKKYGVDGYPTLLVADSDGRELGRSSGYNPGSGVDAVISELKPYSGP